jgi:multidrug efflux pump subunit AcrA (membrane-fusion protein)
MNFSRSLLTIIAALAQVACHSKKENTSESLPPVAVRTIVVENKARPSSEEVVGTVRAKLRAAIEPKVSARIETLLVAPGQMVKTGELIAQLDPREIQAKLDQALALREQATRDLARSRELLDKKSRRKRISMPCRRGQGSPKERHERWRRCSGTPKSLHLLMGSSHANSLMSAISLHPENQ